MDDPTNNKDSAIEHKNSNQRKSEGNLAIGAGVGIGALGVGTTLVAGATCPLCYILAPVLVGVGIVRRSSRAKCSPSSDTKKEP